LHPVKTEVIEQPATQDRHEGACEPHNRRARKRRDQDVEPCLANITEPGRLSDEPLHGGRVEDCNQHVGGESDQQLPNVHADSELGYNVRRKRGKDVDPPASRRHKHQRAKQHDVRRPEWGKDLVRQRAYEECDFGTDEIGGRDGNGLPDVAVEADKRTLKEAGACSHQSLLPWRAERQSAVMPRAA